MVPTRKVSFPLFLRAILYRLSCSRTRNMALLKISHWERLPREPGARREPFLSLTRGHSPLTSGRAPPAPGSDTGCAWKQKPRSRTGAPSAWWTAEATGSPERTSACPRLRGRVQSEMSATLWGAQALRLCPLSSHGQSQGRGTVGATCRGWDPRVPNPVQGCS